MLRVELRGRGRLRRDRLRWFGNVERMEGDNLVQIVRGVNDEGRAVGGKLK